MSWLGNPGILNVPANTTWAVALPDSGGLAARLGNSEQDANRR